MKKILVRLGFAFCLALLCLDQWHLLYLREMRSPMDAQVLRDIPYVTNGHVRQKLDLYLPRNPQGPLLVWIHGGGWFLGGKFNPKVLPFIAKGYCVASIDYRLSQDAIFPAQIEDCKAAIRWLRAHAKEYGYDPNRIGAMGPSAGGHLVAMLATTGGTRKFDVGENLDQPSTIQCGIDQFGITNLADWKPASDAPVGLRSGSPSMLVRLLGGPVDEKMDLAREASPVYWVSKDSAPLFIQHGTKDDLVGFDQSQQLVDKLKAAGVDVTFDVVPGAGHDGPEFWSGNRPEQMVEFLDRYLVKP